MEAIIEKVANQAPALAILCGTIIWSIRQLIAAQERQIDNEQKTIQSLREREKDNHEKMFVIIKEAVEKSTTVSERLSAMYEKMEAIEDVLKEREQ